MREIPITKGYVAIVDDADYGWLTEYKWQALVNVKRNVTHVYAIRSVKTARGRGVLMMHRAILPPPPGMLIDHINFSGLDNRRENLRVCTPSQNTARKRLVNNSYGLRGIEYRGGPRPWHGIVIKDGQRHYTDYVATPAEAVTARDALMIQLHGEFAITQAELEKNLPGVTAEVKSKIAAKIIPKVIHAP